MNAEQIIHHSSFILHPLFQFRAEPALIKPFLLAGRIRHGDKTELFRRFAAERDFDFAQIVEAENG